MTELAVNEAKVYDGAFEKWRKAIFKANMICAGIIFLMEIFIWGIFECQNLRLQPLGDYLTRFLLLPTCTNILILLIGFLAIRVSADDVKVMNYIPLIQMVCLCFSLCVFHNLFSVLLCSFSFPIDSIDCIYSIDSVVDSSNKDDATPIVLFTFKSKSFSIIAFCHASLCTCLTSLV